MEKGTYRGDVAGAHDALVAKHREQRIEMRSRAHEDADPLGAFGDRCAHVAQDGKSLGGRISCDVDCRYRTAKAIERSDRRCVSDLAAPRIAARTEHVCEHAVDPFDESPLRAKVSAKY